MFLIQPNALASPLLLAVVEVKFSREVVSVTEDDGQAPVTVVAMGDLSSGFSIIVMAINGTAYGKLVGGDHCTVQMCVTSAVVCSFSPLMYWLYVILRFKFLLQKTVTLLGICGELSSQL